MKAQPNKRIPAFYLRSARKNCKQIKIQKDKCIKYAKDNDIRKYKFYIDNGYSGKTLDRPKIKRLLADVENGKICSVIVPADNRLLRTIFYQELLELYEFLVENSVEFVDLSDEENQDNNFEEKLERLKHDWAEFQKHSYLYKSFY
ncbi:MAG: recombinase family protein [Oscillospiraceae bacterium]|jgi:DNA invertase Pin-like site-specific DNA recombinase|nr:recombinase family protein [Oscillospiraceae bacterium]